MGTLQDWYHAFSIGGVVAIGLTLLAIRNQVKIMREQAQGIFRQSNTQKEQSDIDRASGFSQRYDTLRKEMDFIYDLVATTGTKEMVQQILTNPDTRKQVYGVWDYFEDLGAHYDLGNIDRPTIQKTLRGPIIRMWDRSATVIMELREARNHREMYSEFEMLANAMKKLA